jgi:hypothetical protein
MPEREPRLPNPVLDSAREAQTAARAPGQADDAVQRTLRQAEQHRETLSPEQRAMVEELRAARGEAKRARALERLVDTLEHGKRQSTTFYEWCADAWSSVQESYSRIQPRAQAALWAIAGLLVAIGTSAALISQTRVARISASLGFRISRGWLVILSFLAMALAMVTRTNPWTAFPAELVVPPLVALVGCAFALRLVDMNYPVWNSLLRGCGAPLISMGFVAAFLELV